MIELIFFGTGSGKTSLSRFHSSFLVATDDTNLLIDAGDGISKAILSQGIEFNFIERIFVTHLHSDHYTGLPSLITQMKMNERKNDLFIYAAPDLLEILKEFILNSYLYNDRLGFSINYIPVDQNIQFEVSHNLKILSRQNSHLNSLIGLDKNSNQSFSSSSLIISAWDKNIHYTSDIGLAQDLQLFNDFDVDILISELTHIQPQDIIDSIRGKIGLETVILTHIDQENMASQEKDFAEFPSEIGKKFIFANDGLKINL